MLDTIRGLMRPFVIVCITGLVVYLGAIGKIEPKYILALAGTIISYLFGERAGLKVPGEENPAPSSDK